MSSAPSKDFLQKAIPEIKTSGGRNIVELAKALHMPVETTRYKVKGMLKRGLSIHASVDYNKLGMTRYYAYFTLSEKAKSIEKKFFNTLADQAYLVSHAKKLPSSEYFSEFAFPRTIDSSFSVLRKFLRNLEGEGVIEGTKVYMVSAQKARMIQSEFFDLKHSAWQIDWSKLKKDALFKDWQESKISDFDYLDLMIVRELESDALTRLSGIADSLKTTLNNIFYHFHKHIMEGKLVEEFVVRWNGTPKRGVILLQLLFTGLTIPEERLTRACVGKLPFVWSEAIGPDTGLYSALGMIPIEEYLGLMNYLSANLDTSTKLEVCTLDAKSYQSYPLPAQMYRDGAWKFNADEVIQQVLKIRK